MEKFIVIRPEKDAFMVVEAEDPEDVTLYLGDLQMNAMLLAHANDYEEACQMIADMQKEDSLSG